MSKTEIIKQIIQEVLDVDLIEITNSAHLIHDLGASEVQFAEIINRIENRFSIVLGFESFDMTIEDLLIVVFSEIQEGSKKMLAKPRPLHDSFVHQLLPGLVFNEGLNLFRDLRYKKDFDYMQGSSVVLDFEPDNLPLKKGLDYLYDLWDGLSIKLKNKEVFPKSLDYEILEKSNKLMLLFCFPEPNAVGEAFYSLFIWNINEPDNEAAKYFTLELSNDNKVLIGQWNKDGKHSIHGSYRLVFTPRQFLDEVLKKLMPREDKSVIDENKDLSVNPQFLVEGLFEKEHIYLKIITALAHKLDLPDSQINQFTPVKSIVKQDIIDVISEVYQMYGIDPKKHLFFIKQDADRYIKDKSEQNLTCSLLVIRICKHFEHRIAGDYDNPKELYLDYRAKIDLISQSSDFAILYNFISHTYPSFITDNAEQQTINNKPLLYKEILTIPDKHLAHNYPIDPRGLFICLTSVAIAHANFTLQEEKMAKYLEAAVSLNTKWGPYIKPGLLDKIACKPKEKKVKFRKLRKAMDSRLLGSIYKMFHELSRK